MIIEAQLPQGTQKIEVPDNLAPDQIDEVLAHAAQSQTAAPATPAADTSSGFGQRMQDDLKKRQDQAAGILDRAAAGQTGSSNMLQATGIGTGLIADTAGNIIGSGARYLNDASGGLLGVGVDAAKKAIGEEIPDSVKNAIGAVVNKGETLAKKYPTSAADLGAFGNIASMFPVGAGGKVAAEGADIAGAVARDAGNTIAANLPEDTLKTLKSKAGGGIRVAAEARPSADEVRNLASDAYGVAEKEGGLLNSKAVNKFIDEASQTVTAKTEEGKAFAGKDDIASKYLDRLQQFKDKPLSLPAIADFDKTLGDAIQQEFDPIKGDYSPAGRNLIQIRHALNKTIEANPEDLVNPLAFASYKKGKDLAATAFRMNDIDRIYRAASFSENPQQAIKAGFTRLAKTSMQGYNDAEKKAIENAARTGLLTGTLKVLGSRLISGIAGAAAGAAGGGAVGVPIGIGVAEAGAYPLRAAAGAMQAAKGEKVKNLLGARPVVRDALQADFEKKKLAAKMKP